MDINFQDILELLKPGGGQVIIWSIFLYIIFFFALITLLVMPNKNMVPTLLIATVLLFAIVAKLSVSAPNVRGSQPVLRPKEFGMLVINAGMFLFPLIAVGMTRARKNRTIAPALITSLAGGVYFFAYWFFAQQV
jgi:hypothetical protein